MTTVASHLLRFRRRKLLNDFRSLGWILLTVVSMGILFFLSLEAIFWFPPFVRYTVWRTGHLGLVIFT
ncbi:MAG: hypothetical protein ACE5GH_04700, partial [Fidelibacterota bacterium]